MVELCCQYPEFFGGFELALSYKGRRFRALIQKWGEKFFVKPRESVGTLFWVEGNNYKDAIPRALLQMEEHLLPSFFDEPGDDEPKPPSSAARTGVLAALLKRKM